ncbi:hypothetical protein SDC9_89741 [bioreactor metagenome]|uniref:Uncharacterized protein n=1 Tax=bioreactor metagenome TaxID=1076179 RepID=A0A644ZRQ8_9ZZZZ
MAAVFPPVLQRKELPAILLEAANVVLSPTQIFASVVATVITGKGLTMTDMDAEPVQLFAVPVTL